MSLGFLMVFLQRYALAVMADDLSSSLGLTGTHLSHLGSMYFYSYALLQIPVGLLVDSLGPRRIIFWGMILVSFGSFFFACSHSILLSYLSRFLIGVGSSPVLICILKFQAVWFPSEEFATITGLTSVIGNLGGIVAATPLALFVMYVGWRVSFLYLGLFSLILALFLRLVIRDFPPDMGSDAVLKKEGENKITLTAALKDVLLNPYTWSNFLVFFGGLGAMMSFSGLWGVPFLMHTLNLSRDAAANQVLFFSVGVVLGSPLWGYLADGLLRVRRVMQVGISLSLFFWVLFLFLLQRGLPYLFISPLLFLMGFFGISVLLSFTVVKEVNQLQYAGISTSVLNIAPFLGTAILNLLVGWRLDTLWEGVMYQGARIYSLQGYTQGILIYVLAVLMALGMTFFLHGGERSL